MGRRSQGEVGQLARGHTSVSAGSKAGTWTCLVSQPKSLTSTLGSLHPSLARSPGPPTLNSWSCPHTVILLQPGDPCPPSPHCPVAAAPHRESSQGLSVPVICRLVSTSPYCVLLGAGVPAAARGSAFHSRGQAFPRPNHRYFHAVHSTGLALTLGLPAR